MIMSLEIQHKIGFDEPGQMMLIHPKDWSVYGQIYPQVAGCFSGQRPIVFVAWSAEGKLSYRVIVLPA